jgi:hypothetical protein
MEDELDRLLRAPLLTPPPDFTGRVMRRIQRFAPPERPSPWRQAMQWFAMAAVGVPATLQLLAFVFNMWAATAAG